MNHRSWRDHPPGAGMMIQFHHRGLDSEAPELCDPHCYRPLPKGCTDVTVNVLAGYPRFHVGYSSRGGRTSCTGSTGNNQRWAQCRGDTNARRDGRRRGTMYPVDRSPFPKSPPVWTRGCRQISRDGTQRNDDIGMGNVSPRNPVILSTPLGLV
ncbi:hypothetical protein BO78DRAFT_231046 [Aspergillus sclerotiicarbonarius CBS 121057]|uniref:Uncharacterized protein n=1 Tax=Aspergillus sclerotiicarbonarius (strain CBS 121057 / IBT 28362) TaxID=1448318 RepID=A0A319DW88_ASPSB|nr:hypothetical protein BO78DRAFT_231046 [Aspergillus sclerotiicarbonarius CBS 121057]